MELSWPQGQGEGDMEALEWAGELGGARTPRFNRKLSHQAFYTICTCSCAARPHACFSQGSESSHL